MTWFINKSSNKVGKPKKTPKAEAQSYLLDNFLNNYAEKTETLSKKQQIT